MYSLVFQAVSENIQVHYANNVYILVWAKVKTAVRNAGSKITVMFKSLLEKHKAKIMAALKTAERVIIIEGKRMVIEFVEGVVKIIADGLVVSSEKIGVTYL